MGPAGGDHDQDKDVIEFINEVKSSRALGDSPDLAFSLLHV
jgi:hypothetical protein